MQRLIVIALLLSVCSWPARAAGTWATVARNAAGPAHLDSLVILPEGGLVVLGNTGKEGARAMLLMRFASDGTLLWQKTYRENTDVWGDVLLPLTDGGYLLCGDPAANNDILLVRTDANGVLLWQRSYGGTRNRYPRYAEERAEGGYRLGGPSFEGNDEGGWLLEIDAAGNILAQRHFKGAWGYQPIHRRDGTWAWAGDTTPSGGAISKGWFARMSATRELVRQQVASSSLSVAFRVVTETSDGGDMLLGYVGDFAKSWANLVLVKVDASGTVKWHKGYGDGKKFYWPNALIETADKGYLAGGYCASTAGGLDAYLLKVDRNGKIQWQKLLGIGPVPAPPLLRQSGRGGGEYESFYTLKERSTGGFFAAGMGPFDGGLAVSVSPTGAIENCPGYVSNGKAKPLSSKLTFQSSTAAVDDTIALAMKQGKAKGSAGMLTLENQCGGD